MNFRRDENILPSVHCNSEEDARAVRKSLFVSGNVGRRRQKRTGRPTRDDSQFGGQTRRKSARLIN